MLISTNKKNNIAKSIALMLALVLAFSCILTACADKTARKDVEDLKATVDALGKDVDTVEGVANSAVTNEALTKALADALAAYLNKEGHDADVAKLLEDYAKTEDAEKFVNETLGTALEGYYTKTEIDAMLASMKEGYFTKAEVEALITNANFVSPEEVPGFIATYLGTQEAEDIIVKLLEETYMDLGDWDAATAEILTAVANLTKAFGTLDDEIYTVEVRDQYVAIMNAAFAAYIPEGKSFEDMDAEQLIVDVFRATDPSKFEYIAKLAKDTAALDNASKAIEAINAKIDALNTASEGKIDTNDEAALDEIKAAIVAFDTKYGFNKTTVTMEIETADFKAAFASTDVLDADALAAKLVIDNGYTSNNDYIEKGGLKMDLYIKMQTRYDELMAWAAEIDEMIVDLVEEIGEEKFISDDQLELIKEVVAEVRGDKNGADDDAKAGFVVCNNEITTPIKGWNTYLYYEWLASKRMFDDYKIEIKADLDAYAAELAAKFESSKMNEENAVLVKGAKEYIDALNFADFKDYGEATAHVDAYVGEPNTFDNDEETREDPEFKFEAGFMPIMANMYENFAMYSFSDTQLKAVADIEAEKAALTAEKYDGVVKLADDYIAELQAIAPNETVKYPNATALKALNEKLVEALTAIELAAAKVDAKEEVMAYAEEKLYGVESENPEEVKAPMFTGDESNFNDIEAFIKAAAKRTYDSIDAVEIIDDIKPAILAAKGVVEAEVYNQLLNLAKAAVQTTVMTIAKDAKNYAADGIDFTAIGLLANQTTINAYAVNIVVDTNNSTETTLDDTVSGAYSIALGSVNECLTNANGTGFYDQDVVKAYQAIINP